jgi:sugar phosphate isomerase/epimerase
MDYKLGLIGGLGNEDDYWQALENLSALGYGAIEGAPFLGEGPEAIREGAERLADIGLECCSVSVSSYELDEKLDDAIETAKAAGARHVSMWYGPAQDEDQLKRDAERYNKAGEKVAAAGLKLCYHNHDHEFFRLMKRTPAIQVLLEETDPDKVFFEPDLGWIAAAGCDPVRFLLENEGRVPVAHLRDLAGPGAPVTWTTPGTGIIDMRALITAAVATGVRYMVYEPARTRNLTSLESITACALNLRDMCLL